MEKFQVDLHGIVAILSQHLYSSPRVFVRELLQNALDAITARRQLEPGWPGGVTITVGDDASVSFEDDGIGLTADEVRELLATIGRSSKRDELDLQREGFLGQFGIGLLSCFLVSDTIEVRTRSASTPDAPTMLWVARGDGTYDLTETEPLPHPGTRVTLRPRHGEGWLSAASVRELATHYGAILPIPITLRSPDAEPTTIAPHPASPPTPRERAVDGQYLAAALTLLNRARPDLPQLPDGEDIDAAIARYRAEAEDLAQTVDRVNNQDVAVPRLREFWAEYGVR